IAGDISMPIGASDGCFGKEKHKDVSYPKQPSEAPIGMLISPAILVIGVIVIGLFPNLFNKTFIAHAASSIVGVSAVESISFWHGFNKPFIMSLIVIIVGTALFLTMRTWYRIYDVIPGSLSFNNFYNATIESLDRTPRNITNCYMRGSLRNYMLIVLGTIFIVTFSFLFASDGFVIKFDDLAPITAFVMVVVLVITVAAVATIFARNNVAVILILGIVGYGVAILFVLYRAPD